MDIQSFTASVSRCTLIRRAWKWPSGRCPDRSHHAAHQHRDSTNPSTSILSNHQWHPSPIPRSDLLPNGHFQVMVHLVLKRVSELISDWRADRKRVIPRTTKLPRWQPAMHIMNMNGPYGTHREYHETWRDMTWYPVAAAIWRYDRSSWPSLCLLCGVVWCCYGVWMSIYWKVYVHVVLLQGGPTCRRVCRA